MRKMVMFQIVTGIGYEKEKMYVFICPDDVSSICEYSAGIVSIGMRGGQNFNVVDSVQEVMKKLGQRNENMWYEILSPSQFETLEAQRLRDWLSNKPSTTVVSGSQNTPEDRAYDVDSVPRERPAYNHTRADGPYDPCEQCLELMSREELLSYVKDMRQVARDRDEET